MLNDRKTKLAPLPVNLNCHSDKINISFELQRQTGGRNARGVITQRSSPGNGQDALPQTRSRNGGPPPRTCKVVLPRQVVIESLHHPVLRALLPVEAGFAQSTGCLHGRMTEADAAIFVYCTGGRGWCELEGQRHNLCPGDLLLVPPRVSHAFGADEGRTWSVSWVHALGANLDFFLAQLGVTAKNPVIPLGDDPRLPALFNEILETLGAGCSMARLILASQAFGHLLGAVICRGAETNKSEPDAWRKIEQSIAYMQEHFDKPLQVPRLAAMANLSPSHYNALFKRRTGCAPIDYFTRLRMQHACHLLSATSMCVKEVAASLGYDDPFYFSRVFKAVNQVAPSDYRTQRKV